MLPPCGLAPNPMPCDDFLPTNLTGNSWPTGRGPARNAAAETEKSLQRFNLIYFLGLFIGHESEEGSKCPGSRFYSPTLAAKHPDLGKSRREKLWSPLSGVRPFDRKSFTSRVSVIFSSRRIGSTFTCRWPEAGNTPFSIRDQKPVQRLRPRD